MASKGGFYRVSRNTNGVWRRGPDNRIYEHIEVVYPTQAKKDSVSITESILIWDNRLKKRVLRNIVVPKTGLEEEISQEFNNLEQLDKYSLRTCRIVPVKEEIVKKSICQVKTKIIGRDIETLRPIYGHRKEWCKVDVTMMVPSFAEEEMIPLNELLRKTK